MKTSTAANPNPKPAPARSRFTLEGAFTATGRSDTPARLPRTAVAIVVSGHNPVSGLLGRVKL